MGRKDHRLISSDVRAPCIAPWNPLLQAPSLYTYVHTPSTQNYSMCLFHLLRSSGPGKPYNSKESAKFSWTGEFGCLCACGLGSPPWGSYPRQGRRALWGISRPNDESPTNSIWAFLSQDFLKQNPQRLWIWSGQVRQMAGEEDLRNDLKKLEGRREPITLTLATVLLSGTRIRTLELEKRTHTLVCHLALQ